MLQLFLDKTKSCSYGISEKAARYHEFYMDVAYRSAKLSFAKRRQVGAVLVADNNIVAFGFNGTPTGHDNICEDFITGETLESVIHAEDNIIRKTSWRDWICASLYVTKEPCVACANKLLDRGSGFTLYYKEVSKSKPSKGLELLTEAGVSCFRVMDA